MSTTSPQTVQVVLPELGESVTEGVVVEWRIAEGDRSGRRHPPGRHDRQGRRGDPGSGHRPGDPDRAQPGESVEVGALLAELQTGGDGRTAARRGRGEAPGRRGRGRGRGRGARRRRAGRHRPARTWSRSPRAWWWSGGPRSATRSGPSRPWWRSPPTRSTSRSPAPAAGTLAEIAVEAGETFAVGQPLGRIAVGADGAGPPADAPEPTPAAAAAGRARRRGRADGDLEWPRISPVARRLAADRGIDPATVRGTGPGGMVRKADVLAASPGAPATGNGGGARDARRARRPPARRPSPSAAPRRRSPATWTRASRSRPPRASARSASGVLDAQRRADQRRPEGGRPRREALLHPPHGLGAGPGGAGACRSWAPGTGWWTGRRTSWCARR